MGQQEKSEFLKKFSEALKAIRTRRGWSQEELAEKLGVAPSSVGNWESQLNGPTRARLMKIAETLGVSVDYLSGTMAEPLEEKTTGYTVRRKFPEEQRIQAIKSLKGSRGEIRMAPVHSWASAGRAHDYQDMEDFMDEEVPTTHRDPHAFALIVEGDSMEPKFEAGDFIILAPHSEPRSGDLVVARVRESEGVFFKVYRLQPNGTVALISYNPKYPELNFRKSDFLYVYPVVGVYRNTVR